MKYLRYSLMALLVVLATCNVNADDEANTASTFAVQQQKANQESSTAVEASPLSGSSGLKKKRTVRYINGPSAFKRYENKRVKQLPFKWGKRSSYNDKLKQMPFKWGKRSSFSDNLQQQALTHEMCTDLFAVLVGHGQQESRMAKMVAVLDRADIELLYNECFGELYKTLVDDNEDQVAAAEEEAAISDSDDQQIDDEALFGSAEIVKGLSAKRSEAKSSGHIKRYNMPFRWGK